MCVKVAVDPPSPMKNAPPEMRPVVMKCLEKSPEQRYATMAELGAALRPFARDPHAAGILVERMQRMHERGGYVDWAVGTPAVSTLPPESQALLAVAAAAAAAPKDDIANAAPVPAQILKPPREVPGRRRNALTESTLKGPPSRRRRGGLLLLLLMALVGIAAAVAMFVFGDRREPEMTPVVPPGEPAKLPAAQPDEAKVAAPDEPKPTERDAAAGTPASGAAVKKSVPTIEKRPPVKAPKDDPKGLGKPPEVPKPPKPACDVYADPHGCQT
jgi:serine/threonine-protein kinase